MTIQGSWGPAWESPSTSVAGSAATFPSPTSARSGIPVSSDPVARNACVWQVLNPYLTLSFHVQKCKIIVQMYDPSRNRERPCEEGRSCKAIGRPLLSNPGAPGEKHFLRNKCPTTSYQAERPQKKLFLQNKRPAVNVGTKACPVPRYGIGGTRKTCRSRHSGGSRNPGWGMARMTTRRYQLPAPFSHLGNDS